MKNAEKADSEYRIGVDKLVGIESRFYDSEMPQILTVILVLPLYVEIIIINNVL